MNKLKLESLNVYPEYNKIEVDKAVPGIPIATSTWEYNDELLTVYIATATDSAGRSFVECAMDFNGVIASVPFDADLKNIAPDKIELYLQKQACKLFDLNEYSTSWTMPRYAVQVYDMPNDRYITYADTDSIENARLNAHSIDKLKLNNHDEILIFDRKENRVIWRDSDILTFRLYMDVEFNRELTDEDWVGYEGFTFSFREFPSADFDFEECEGGRTEDKSIVELCGRNPDYEGFSDTLFLTRKMLSNVESVEEIRLDYTEYDEEDENFLYPVRIRDAAFVIINDDGSMDEIPIPVLEGWEFPDAKEYEEEKEK